MMNLKIKFAKNNCLDTICSTEMFQIAWTYPAKEHYKNAYFLWLCNLTPSVLMANYLWHNFDARLQKTCDAAVPDIPLHWYKLNWPITCYLPESWTDLSGAFLFLSGICWVLKRIQEVSFQHLKHIFWQEIKLIVHKFLFSESNVSQINSN